MGHTHGHAVLGRRCLPRTEGGTGVRGRHTHSHHSRGRVYGGEAQQGPRRERHHTEHRRVLGSRGGGCHLHPAGHIHTSGQVPGDERVVSQGVHIIAAWRHLRHTVPHTVPQVLRERHARQVPLPRGHGHHTGARERRQGRQPGQAAAAGRTRGRTLRLHSGHVRVVERELHHARGGMGPGPCRPCQAGVQGQHGRGGARTGLHRGPEVRVHHLPRLVRRVVVAGAGHVDSIP